MNEQDWQNGRSAPGYPQGGQYPAGQGGYPPPVNAWADEQPDYSTQQYGHQYGQPQPQPQPTQPVAPQGGRPNPVWVIAALACVAVLVAGGIVVLFTLDRPGQSDEIELAGSTQSTSQGVEQPAPTGQSGLPPAEQQQEQSAPTQRAPRSGRTQTTSSAPPRTQDSEPEPEPDPEPVPQLSRPSGARLSVSVDADSADEVAAVQTLADHGDAINAGNYSTAFALFSSGMQDRMNGESNWAEGLSTSYWENLDVTSVSTSGGSATVKVRLRTSQDPEYGDGQTCSVFTNTYTLSSTSSGWKISDVKGNGKSGC